MNLQLSSSPLVSVVIPVYNGEMHISVCMDSILCQSFSSFEAIFVDDGSVDNSFRILSERASFDRRMKVIRQENMGVTCARRNGVKHAGGKYICFVDCDDRLLPDTLDILYNKALLSDADIVCGNSSYADRIKFDHLQTPLGYAAALLEQKVDLVVWAKLFRKSVLTDDVFDISSHIKFAEDYIMNIRIAFHAERIYFIHDLIYQYSEYNEDSVTSTFQLTPIYVQEICGYVLDEVRRAKAEDTLHKSVLLFLKYMIWMMIHQNVLEMDNDWTNKTIREIAPVLSSRESIYSRMRSSFVFPILKKLKDWCNRLLNR